MKLEELLTLVGNAVPMNKIRIKPLGEAWQVDENGECIRILFETNYKDETDLLIALRRLAPHFVNLWMAANATKDPDRLDEKLEKLWEVLRDMEGDEDESLQGGP